MLHRLLGLFLFFSTFTVGAQSYSKFYYNQKNGLPQNSVNSLFWDSTKFLWISTEDGLVRFDGHSFYTFNINNTPFFSNDRFRSILKNTEGALLVSSVDGSLFELSGHRPKPYLSPENVYQQYAGTLPGKETLKELLSYGPLSIFPKKWRYYPTSFAQDNGNSYVLGFSYLYKLSGLNHIDSIPHAPEIRFLFNIGKYMYVADYSHIYYVDTRTQKLLPVLFSNPSSLSGPISLFPQASSQNLCIINQHKLFVCRVDSIPTRLTSEFKIDVGNQVANEISSVCYDESSDMFAMGSVTSGLYIFKPRLFNTLAPKTNESRNGYYSNVALNDSTIMSNYGDEISYSNISPSKMNLRVVNYQLLHSDTRHRIWSSRADTLFYQARGGKRYPMSLFYPEYITTFAASGDSLLVFSYNHAFLLKDTSIIYRAPLEYNNKPHRIQNWSALLFANNKWMLGSEDGIYEIELSKTAHLTKVYNYQQVRFLTQIGNFVIGGSYGDGWFAIVNGKLTKLPIDPKQYLNKVHAVVFDGKDKLFLSTNNGLFSTTLTQLKNYLSDSTQSMYFQYFDDNEGIDNVEFNGGCYSPVTRLNNGYISFANMAGLVWFKSDQLRFPTQPSKSIYIDAIEVDQISIPLSDTILVQAQTENLTITISSIYWSNPYNLRLEYKLEGFTKNWLPINIKSPIISFTNLPSGEYDLIIRSRYGFSSSDISEHTIHIIKEPRFYESMWFLLAMLSLLFAALFGLNTLINKQLRSRNLQLEERVLERTSELQNANQQLIKSEKDLMQSVNIKNKLISIISHDIVTPLRFISLVSKEYKSDTSKSTQSEIIREIHHTSFRLHDNAQNILNWVRYQNNLIKVNKSRIAPFALVEEISELFKDVASMRKNTIINEVDMDDIIVSDKNILIIILQNIISNAVKYTHSSTIQIHSSKDENQYTLSISDDGNGMSENNLKRIEAIRSKSKTNMFDDSADGTGLGYVIIFELLELIGADLEIQSTQNKGTKVTIILN